jgi:hypothetical protein
MRVVFFLLVVLVTVAVAYTGPAPEADPHRGWGGEGYGGGGWGGGGHGGGWGGHGGGWGGREGGGWGR